MLMPVDRHAESNLLSLIYRKPSQEEMKGPDWADAVSLSVSPVLSSFFMPRHICLRKRSADVDWDTILVTGDCSVNQKKCGVFWMWPLFQTHLSLFVLAFVEFAVLLKNGMVLLDRKDREFADGLKDWTQIQNCAGAWYFSQPIHSLNNTAELCW